jgi:hypothetical protein
MLQYQKLSVSVLNAKSARLAVEYALSNAASSPYCPLKILVEGITGSKLGGILPGLVGSVDGSI